MSVKAAQLEDHSIAAKLRTNAYKLGVSVSSEMSGL